RDGHRHRRAGVPVTRPLAHGRRVPFPRGTASVILEVTDRAVQPSARGSRRRHRTSPPRHGAGRRVDYARPHFRESLEGSGKKRAKGVSVAGASSRWTRTKPFAQGTGECDPEALEFLPKAGRERREYRW